MRLAACIECGYLNKKPLKVCPGCGFNPRAASVEEQALSIYFSTDAMDPCTGEYKNEAQVRRAAAAIRRGVRPPVDEDQIHKLVQIKSQLDFYPVPLWKVALLLSAIVILSLSPLLVAQVIATLIRLLRS